MKPRTKLQVEVFRCSRNLIKHDRMMVEFAKKSCLLHVGYATKNRVVCMECGNRFSTELVKRKRAVCPHCSEKLTIKESRNTTLEQVCYVAIAETYTSAIYGEFQVIRNYKVKSTHRANWPAEYSGYEVLQHWYLDSQRREVVARSHYVSYGCDAWNGDMEIRDKNYKQYWETAPRYEILPDKYHPDSKFKLEFTKYGINYRLCGLTFLEALRILPDYPHAETLLKAKQYELLRPFRYNESYKVRRYWPSIKICLRNKYQVKDDRMWFDYLEMLQYFRKDLHNAHYVCPKDLQKAHDKLMNKKREIIRREQEQKDRERALKDEAKFQELKQKFFGLVFKDELLEVKVLESVQAHMEEGDKMHHCVFTSAYHLKADSLILSAMIQDKKIETVEVSLKNMKVVQSRGVNNQPTEHHERIVQLVNRNIRQIKKRKQLEAV